MVLFTFSHSTHQEENVMSQSRLQCKWRLLLNVYLMFFVSFVGPTKSKRLLRNTMPNYSNGDISITGHGFVGGGR